MNDCRIVEDLLPLYEEDLLHKETVDWIETHLSTCESCRSRANETLAAFPAAPIKPKNGCCHDEERTFKACHLSAVVCTLIICLCNEYIDIRRQLSIYFKLFYPWLQYILFLPQLDIYNSHFNDADNYLVNL